MRTQHSFECETFPLLIYSLVYLLNVFHFHYFFFYFFVVVEYIVFADTFNVNNSKESNADETIRL